MPGPTTPDQKTKRTTLRKSSPKEQFTSFRTLSQEPKVRMLISKAAGESCQLDPIPTPIVLKLLDVLLPVTLLPLF